ncbi:MAG: type II toxin-antitoxin system Phd/YefM family antitoxin [Vicinamibacteria bacterium]
MRKINVKDAREKLSALLDEVAAGEEVVLLRRGKEVARLVPPRARGKRLPGLETLRRSITIKGRPLSEEVTRGRRDERF